MLRQRRTIRAITERVSPRVFRLCAAAPSDREKSKCTCSVTRSIFLLPGNCHLRQKLVQPRGSGIRDGFLHQRTASRFLQLCPNLRVHCGRWNHSHQVLDGGGKKEQQRRFEARIKDPLRQWSSPNGLGVVSTLVRILHARDKMLEATDSKHAPWYIVRTDDKRKRG